MSWWQCRDIRAVRRAARLLSAGGMNMKIIITRRDVDGLSGDEGRVPSAKSAPSPPPRPPGPPGPLPRPPCASGTPGPPPPPIQPRATRRICRQLDQTRINHRPPTPFRRSFHPPVGFAGKAGDLPSRNVPVHFDLRAIGLKSVGAAGFSARTPVMIPARLRDSHSRMPAPGPFSERACPRLHPEKCVSLGANRADGAILDP